MLTNPHASGLFAGPDAECASRLIWETGRLIGNLAPAGADLGPAEAQLAAAEQAYATRDYSEAAAQAERAAELASSLSRRFTAYVGAWKALQTRIAQLEDLGLPTDDQSTALDAADQEVVHLVEEEGETVPNYLGATALLEETTAEAGRLVDRARVASREIFLATLGIEALSNPRVGPMHEALAMRLERMIEQASHELALGHISEARKVGSLARARADQALASAAVARARLRDSSHALRVLDARGPAAAAVGERVDATRDAMSGGLVDGAAAAEAARRVSAEAADFAEQYGRSRKLLENSERLHAGLGQEGLPSGEGGPALSGARRDLDVGNWAGVKEQVASASATLMRLRDQRAVVALAIIEISERAATLEERGSASVHGVQDLLNRAKDALRTGRLRDACVDVLRARDLVDETSSPTSETAGPVTQDCGDAASSPPAGRAVDPPPPPVPSGEEGTHDDG